MEVNGDNVNEVFPERINHNSQIAKLRFDIINIFILRGPEYFEDVQEIYPEFPFELMIADAMFTAIPMVKECRNIPVITIGIMPLTETSKDIPPMGLGMAPSYSFLGKLKQRALRFLLTRFCSSIHIM
ncbi:MAG: hypothetical protein C4330_02485 [Chitinophagaceae bacterium]